MYYTKSFRSVITDKDPEKCKYLYIYPDMDESVCHGGERELRIKESLVVQW